MFLKTITVAGLQIKVLKQPLVQTAGLFSKSTNLQTTETRRLELSNHFLWFHDLIKVNNA
jgi:hypothetical protein